MPAKQHSCNADALYSRILLEKKSVSESFQQSTGMFSPSGFFFFFLYASCNIKKYSLPEVTLAYQYQYLKGTYKKDEESICKGKKRQDKEEWF